MGWTYRRTVNLGPIKLTFSPAGVSTSIGVGPVRFTRGANGSTYRTVRIPGTGVYNRKKTG